MHAIALSAFFGHLNRIADFVGVPLHYEVLYLPPHAEPATPALSRVTARLHGTPALAMESRPATNASLLAWRDCIISRTPMSAQSAAWVAELLGDGEPVPEEPSVLRQLVECVTLAPWQCRNESFTELRETAFDDPAFIQCVYRYELVWSIFRNPRCLDDARTSVLT